MTRWASALSVASSPVQIRTPITISTKPPAVSTAL